MGPTVDFALALVDRLRDGAHGGRLLPRGLG
ncbi:hypothetical protein M878_42005 [Streptomyces roseochromogenus subsp. oscitans DS 12.976]|uniref:Uncharacterized protein n=1 Tax=Streptomyces roseochromogenus subsp. oscitans DS 12.976 TaxID=1352936 RepID=V6JHZ3_STRRC|nr:hypothetical protein M878_42005 [Streptomyces roseochromogenus subsp. oscitans DS 12.976]